MNSDLYGIPGTRSVLRLGAAHAAFWTAVTLVVGAAFLLPSSGKSGFLALLCVLILMASLLCIQVWDALENRIFQLGLGIWPVAYRKLRLALQVQGAGALIVGVGFLVINTTGSTGQTAERILVIALGLSCIPLWLFSIRNTLRFREELLDQLDLAAEANELIQKSSNPQMLDRVAHSVAVFSGEESGSPTPGQRGFRLIGLESNNYHAVDSLPWVKAFEDNYLKIREEAHALARNLPEVYEDYNYPGVAPDNWQIIELFADGHFSTNVEHCPVTKGLLETIPGHPNYREVVFSRLDGGGQIKPHRDYGNLYLTLHLALDIPGRAWMKVGAEKVYWEEGKAVIFDTSYEHEVLNESQEPRLVLIVDFPHPALNGGELAFTDLFR